MLFLKSRLLLRLLCKENRASLPGDSASELSDEAIRLSLAWPGVGETGAGRATACRKRRGGGSNGMSFWEGVGDVGGVVRLT